MSQYVSSVAFPAHLARKFCFITVWALPKALQGPGITIGSEPVKSLGPEGNHVIAVAIQYHVRPLGPGAWPQRALWKQARLSQSQISRAAQLRLPFGIYPPAHASHLPRNFGKRRIPASAVSNHQSGGANVMLKSRCF